MNISSTSCRTVVVAALAGLLGSVSALPLPLPARSQDAAPQSQAEAITKKPRGAEIVIHGGYPELHVAGEPFFIHSAAFFYDRIPRDLWNPALDRYRNLGINTIDLYIPWNWHQPREGEFDFEGKTNARRDLRGLLRLIAAKNLKLIARPGPLILNEWRLGGYPEWLLTRPDYPAADKMDEIDLIRRPLSAAGRSEHARRRSRRRRLAWQSHAHGLRAEMARGCRARACAVQRGLRRHRQQPREIDAGRSDG